MVETSIAIIMVTITLVFAYIGRNTDKDYLKSFFSTLAIYMLPVLSAIARAFADDSLTNASLTTLLGRVYIVTLLIALFMTFLQVYYIVIYYIDKIRNKEKGVSFDG